MPASRRRALRVAALVLYLLLLGACRAPGLVAAKPQPVRGGGIAEALVGTAGTINPLFAQEENARDIDRLVYQGLTRIGPNQQPQPLLASAWSLSADRTTYTVTLRPGARWADGAPFSADDVLFTMSVLQNSAYQEPLGRLWRGVKADSPLPGVVRFQLKAPDASFPAALQVGIIAKHLFTSASPDAVAADPHSTTLALGTGPFRVASISRDHRLVVLKRNPYAVPQPHLDTFTFRSFPTLDDAVQAFATGVVDAVGGIQPPQQAQLSRRPDMQLLSARTYALAAVLLNVSSADEVLADQTVRLALVEGVNRRKIVDGVLQGRADVAPGPIPPSNWAYSPSSSGKHRYSQQNARQLLAEAGWTLAPGARYRSRAGKTLALSLVAVDSYPYSQVATSITEQLGEIGVQVRLQTVPAAVLVENNLLGRHYQMLLAAFDNGSDPDEYAIWHSNPQNSTLSFDRLPGQALIDKDLEDGRTAMGRAARLAVYADFQQLMAEAAPAIFLYEPHYLYALSGRIHGAHLNSVVQPGDRFDFVSDWFVPAQG